MDLPTLDKCPGYNLYIGGFIALRRPKALQNCQITHIVSVMDWQFDEDNALTRGFAHLHIPVDDVDDENLLRYFPQAVEFIHKGLNPPLDDRSNDVVRQSSNSDAIDRGNGVLIHCAMGKSRSATVLLAYLLWRSRQPVVGNNATPSSSESDEAPLPPRPLSVADALMLLRQGRPIAEPNEGFMEQLYMYTDMGCPTTLAEIESHKLYRRFMNKRNVAESLSVNQAPNVVDIRFEDENESDGELPVKGISELDVSKDKPIEEVAPGVAAPTGEAESGSQPSLQVRCRRCRHVLATAPHIAAHTPSRSDPASQPCAHIFLHPLSWMRNTLAEGELDGRLSCPNRNCGVNLGKFAWQGLRCSCGGWVTPGFGVGRGKVDEVNVGSKSTQQTTMGGGGAGIRLPPGMRRGGNL